MNRDLTVIFPTTALLAMNHERRMHYHQRAKVVAAIRTEVAQAAADITPCAGPVTITARFQWATNQRRDTSNWFPTVKAAVDGLVDAGVLPGDHDTIVRDTSIGVDLPANPGLKGYARLALTITEVDG